jgi:predicted transglutaminase-like cysteine proteinase
MPNRLAVLLALFMAGCSSTAGVNTTAAIGPSKVTSDPVRMDSRGVAFPPPAFKSFCAHEPRLCGSTGSKKSVTLTPGRRAELESVNVAVNRRISEVSDRQSVGKDDDWRLPTTSGDCEDIAILKKAELMKRGWPASVLLLTVARSGGEGHVVLTVRTDKGDLVLDNQTNAIRDWSRSPYRYFARQSQSQHGKWERIGKSS